MSTTIEVSENSDDSDEKELWLPVVEAAKHADVSERTLRRWHTRGKLKARKRKGVLQYDVGSIDGEESDTADQIAASTELLRAVKEREHALFGVMLDAIQKTTQHVLAENTQLRSHVQGVEKDLRRTSKLIDEAHTTMIEREANMHREARGEERKTFIMQWMAGMAQRAFGLDASDPRLKAFAASVSAGPAQGSTPRVEPTTPTPAPAVDS